MQSLSESFYIAAALIVSGDEGLWAIVLLSLKVSLSAVIIAGVAGLSAGAMSMAAGEYVSVSSQSDIEQADIEREARNLKDFPNLRLIT